MSSSVLTLRAVLGLDSSEYDKGLDDSSNKANNFAGKLKNVFGAAAKATAAAFTAAAAGVTALTTAAFNSYSEYEQLAGGINKLFGEENAKIVAQYAEQAYLTSGKSINEYYNSVSQITASLKRSIGDDMEEVARVADVAMQVISDNVNTFGSDAEFVENAIMGLSRQNYTMIDNLKLGYAGTAQGMLELINDSGILGRTLKDTSELATVGFDQMILAIQEVQKQQGIAGTTANEAMKTIQGSVKATKSAWENVMIAIGRGEGIEEAIANLESVIFSDNREEGLLNQVTNLLKTIIPSAARMATELLGQFVPRIISEVPSFVVEALPAIIEATQSIIGAVAETLPQIISAVSGLIPQIAGTLLSSLPQFVGAGVSIILSLIQGLSSSLPSLIAMLPTVITDIITTLASSFPQIVETGAELIVNLGVGLIKAIPQLVANLPTIIAAIVKGLGEGIGSLFTVGVDLVEGLWNGINSVKDWILGKIRSFGSSIVSGIKSFFGIHSPSTLFRDQIGKNLALGLEVGFEKYLPVAEMVDAMQDAVDEIGNVGLDNAFEGGLVAVPETTTTTTNSSIGVAGGITINVYGGDKDVNEIVDEVIDAIESNIMMTRRVYQ